MNFIFASIFLIASVVAAENVAQWSERCNPTVFPPTVCAPGLRCVTPPRRMGAPGYCCNEVGLGQRCGGAVQFADVCGSNLVCYNPPTPGVVGSAGVCRPLARVGEPCGGTVQYPSVCEQGCECTAPPRGVLGGQGYCRRT